MGALKEHQLRRRRRGVVLVLRSIFAIHGGHGKRHHSFGCCQSSPNSSPNFVTPSLFGCSQNRQKTQ
uniref:Putative secreted protein n=1 Tax=Anopheles marajoara TaxID=58244 RepID=A0A2M4CFG7_9DIPT